MICSLQLYSACNQPISCCFFPSLPQDDLKASDRVLLEIFKQLESDVEELTDNISNWKPSGSLTPGRPISFSDLDFPHDSSSSTSSCRNPPSESHSLASVGAGGPAYAVNTLETILDSSQEDIASQKEENEPEIVLIPDSPSVTSCSPVMRRPLKFQYSVGSGSVRSNAGSTATKRYSDVGLQMRGSTSLNKLANSPSISRLQDDGPSTMSRNSSIDSGIQFASEAESSSSNVMVEAAIPAPVTVSVPTNEDLRKSVGFADDIFAALGL